MTRPLIVLLILTILSLACGVQGALPTKDFLPVPATEQPVSATLTPTGMFPPVTATKTAVSLPIDGCWHIRSEPSVDAPVLRVQCGGSLPALASVRNGFVRIGDGEYVCNRAFGTEEECR